MKTFLLLFCLYFKCQPLEWEKMSERIFNKITKGLKQSLNGEFRYRTDQLRVLIFIESKYKAYFKDEVNT